MTPQEWTQIRRIARAEVRRALESASGGGLPQVWTNEVQIYNASLAKQGVRLDHGANAKSLDEFKGIKQSELSTLAWVPVLTEPPLPLSSLSPLSSPGESDPSSSSRSTPRMIRRSSHCDVETVHLL